MTGQWRASQNRLAAIYPQGESVMEAFENVAASANDGRKISVDKLAKITGIKEKTAGALYELGIYGYADLIPYLSQHTAQEVSKALKKQGVNRPPFDKESWIRQAETLNQPDNTAPTPPEGETEPAKKLEKVPASHEGQKHDAKHDAEFTVFFDVMKDEGGEPVLHTTVYDPKNAGTEKVFQGSDPSPWVNWIAERANLPLAIEHVAAQAEVTGEPPPTETEASAPPVPAGQYDAQLEIGDVQVSPIEPTSQFPEKRLKAEISFRLSGAAAETLTSQRISFRIEGYTVDLESGALELVASERSRLKPKVFEYKGQQEFAVPDIGRYEFYSIVHLLPPREMVVAYHRCSTIIKIVPPSRT